MGLPGSGSIVGEGDLAIDWDQWNWICELGQCNRIHGTVSVNVASKMVLSMIHELGQ